MKFFFAIIISNLVGFAALASDPTPQVVPASYKNLYSPKGFDTNDNVQLTAEGTFASSCFKIAPPKITVSETNKIITLDAQAYKYSGMCMQLMIPFQQVIDLGIVKTAGLYKLQTADGRALGEVDIVKARTTQADDFLYAPVQRVSFTDGPTNQIQLRMELSQSCLKVAEIKIDKQEHVIVLQPILKLEHRFGCAMGYYPVTQTVELGSMKPGRYLIHVRSSGSQAVNQIIAVE